MDGSQKYDIFISYRRTTGANAARMMQLALTARGYSVFLDYDSLEDGKFNEAIYSAIDSCEVFILMMTEGALDRCMNPGDWVRLEIQRAIEREKNIVPVAPSDQTWSFPDSFPQELSAIRNVHVSKLDMEELFNESIVKIETARFPKTVRERCRNVDRSGGGVKHTGGTGEGGSAPLLLHDMRKRVMQRLADLQQLHDSIDEFRNCRERASDWDSHIAHADDLWRKVCGIRSPASIGEADKSLSRIGRSYTGVKDEVDWLRCQQEQERKQEKREQMLGWRLLEWWEASDLRGWLQLATVICGVISLGFLIAGLHDEKSFYVLIGRILGVVSCCVLLWWTKKWYYKKSEVVLLILATTVVGFCVYWWIPVRHTYVVDGVDWVCDECLWFSLVGDVGMHGRKTEYLWGALVGPESYQFGRAIKKDVTGDIAIPTSLGGRPVVEILDDAFHGCTDLSSVSIPRTVKKIGRGSFAECRNLVAVRIPSSVMSIGAGAFSSGVRSIGIGISPRFGADKLEVVYVDVGDGDRVKELMLKSGKDVSKIRFIEQ